MTGKGHGVDLLPIMRPDRQGGATRPRPVLIVDDSKAQRKILSMQLSRWGYPTVEAASGEDALALCRATDFQIVLSDWMMPGMTGLEFCKAFRGLPREGYGYFILLTSKSEKTEIADGLENGADDFLTKPVSSDELRARLRAGERILGMQDELVEKNRLIGSTLGELQKLYDSLDRDLIEARKLQEALVRDRQLEFATGSASVLLRPSGHVGGDLVGTFQINPGTIAIYSVDVAGHGIASAMMTARLAALLSGGSPDQNIAMSVGAYGRSEAWPPEMVAHRLNRMMTEGFAVDQYFTMAYAEIDLFTGQVRLVQAGHPHPLVMRAAGGVEKIGAGGMPIGLIEGCSYDRVTFSLSRGDRLFLMSDGITECPNPQGEELGVDGLIAFLNKNKGLKSVALLEALMWDLSDFAGQPDFPDDVSGILFDYRGPG
jgi:sigma-B regulation protein RsbU (phosphoserine phosphatase)